MPEGSQDSRLYGMTFILRHYIEEKWTELFDLVSFSEAPGDYQDVVVLRRRGAA
jgi:hypothetical protein